VYRNSVTRSGHGLFTLGSETSGGMRNIEVYGLKAIGTNIGIRFKSAKVRGGVIENIWFHNIEMDKVNFPFHFELNWYPAYSYPVIPESIPRDSIPEHWIVMTTPVMPPEKGIPDFHDLIISDVTVKNARRAFHVNAYEEIPIRNVAWKNVSISAEEAGFINHARDWTMQNVSLSVPDNGQIELTNCVNVEVPEYAAMPETSNTPAARTGELRTLLDSLGSGGQTAVITALDGRNNIILSGDTLYSDTIRVILIPGEDTAFRFFEPMGDGFYITPVNISMEGSGRGFSISGERTHYWEFFALLQSRPEDVRGADAWYYDAETHWLIVKKEGNGFDLQVTPNP